MKFSCETSMLSKGIKIVRKAISSNPNAPIFSGIHFILQENELELVAMDLSFSMSYKITVTGEENGEVLIPAKLIGDLLLKFDNEMIKLENNSETTELIISSSKGTFNIPMLPVADYPKFQELTGERKIIFSDKSIGELINKTIYACSTDENRPLFTGVLMSKEGEKVTFVGTNTHRLAIKTIVLDRETTTDDFSIVIPARVLKEISSNIGKELPEDVEMDILKKQIMVKVGSLIMVSSLIEGTFPNYKKVIPSFFAITAVLKVKELEKAVERVAIFSRDEYSIVRLNVNSDKIILSSSGSDMGQGKEKVDCQTEGDKLNIAFNSKYILDILKYSDAEEVKLKMNDSLHPICIKPVSDEDYLYIVTPVRVVF